MSLEADEAAFEELYSKFQNEVILNSSDYYYFNVLCTMYMVLLLLYMLMN